MNQPQINDTIAISAKTADELWRHANAIMKKIAAAKGKELVIELKPLPIKRPEMIRRV